MFEICYVIQESKKICNVEYFSVNEANKFAMWNNFMLIHEIKFGIVHT